MSLPENLRQRYDREHDQRRRLEAEGESLPPPWSEAETEDEPKGEPRIISDTEGEDITPDNPETIKQFPVDTTDKEAVENVEKGNPAVDQYNQPLGTTRYGTTR